MNTLALGHDPSLLCRQTGQLRMVLAELEHDLTLHRTALLHYHGANLVVVADDTACVGL